MSKLVKECQRENERVQMLETAEEDEDSDSESGSNYNSEKANAVVLYEDGGSKLSEAQTLLNRILMQKDAIERGVILPIEPGEEEEEDKDVEEQKKLDQEENQLKKRLQEQEDYLAGIMKEIEEKEKMLKNAIDENNKYLGIEDLERDSQELSAQSAASKFSSMRSNLRRKDMYINSEVPEDKVIEELPEEDDEEENKLNQMLEEAQNFNIDYEYDQSNNFDSEKKPLYLQLDEAENDEERQKILDQYDLYDELLKVNNNEENEEDYKFEETGEENYEEEKQME